MACLIFIILLNYARMNTFLIPTLFIFLIFLQKSWTKKISHFSIENTIRMRLMSIIAVHNLSLSLLLSTWKVLYSKGEAIVNPHFQTQYFIFIMIVIIFTIIIIIMIYSLAFCYKFDLSQAQRQTHFLQIKFNCFFSRSFSIL